MAEAVHLEYLNLVHVPRDEQSETKTPLESLEERMALLEKAVELSPENSNLQRHLAFHYFSVFEMRQLESENPLTDVTLLSDGITIFAAHSADEVVDVFRRGQGVFGIAVGPVHAQLVGEIHRLFPDAGENASVTTLTPARMEA